MPARIGRKLISVGLMHPLMVRSALLKGVFSLGSGYFASRGKIAPCYFAIWRQNSPNGYFAASAKLALRL